MQTYIQSQIQGYSGRSKSRSNSGCNCDHKAPSAKLRLRLAISPRPAAFAAVVDTTPRPLTPPSQPRGRGQRSGLQKKITKQSEGHSSEGDGWGTAQEIGSGQRGGWTNLM